MCLINLVHQKVGKTLSFKDFLQSYYLKNRFLKAVTIFSTPSDPILCNNQLPLAFQNITQNTHSHPTGFKHQAKFKFQSIPINSSNPIKFDASEAEVIARNLRAESHVIGWFYLCIGMFLGVFVMFLFRCKSKYSYEQGNYIDR